MFVAAHAEHRFTAYEQPEPARHLHHPSEVTAVLAAATGTGVARFRAGERRLGRHLAPESGDLVPGAGSSRPGVPGRRRARRRRLAKRGRRRAGSASSSRRRTSSPSGSAPSTAPSTPAASRACSSSAATAARTGRSSQAPGDPVGADVELPAAAVDVARPLDRPEPRRRRPPPRRDRARRRHAERGRRRDVERPPAGRPADCHSLAWHPNASGRAYEAGGGGAAWSRDGGELEPGRRRPRPPLHLGGRGRSRGPRPAGSSPRARARSPRTAAARRRPSSTAGAATAPGSRSPGGFPQPLDKMPYALAFADGLLVAGLADGRSTRAATSATAGATWARRPGSSRSPRRGAGSNGTTRRSLHERLRDCRDFETSAGSASHGVSTASRFVSSYPSPGDPYALVDFMDHRIHPHRRPDPSSVPRRRRHPHAHGVAGRRGRRTRAAGRRAAPRSGSPLDPGARPRNRGDSAASGGRRPGGHVGPRSRAGGAGPLGDGGIPTLLRASVAPPTAPGQRPALERAGRPAQGLRNLDSGGGEVVPGPLGLVRVPAKSGDALEVGLEDDRAGAPGDGDDQAVEHGLGLDRLVARRRVAVVDDDERDPARLHMRANTGMFDLPPHSTIEICARSASWPSAAKIDGSTSFSVRPSTRIAQRERKSSLRSASNSLTTRNASSASSGWAGRCAFRASARSGRERAPQAARR